MHDPDAPPPPPEPDLGGAPANNDLAADNADGATTSARSASNHGRPYKRHRTGDYSATAGDDVEVPDIEPDPAAAAALTRLGTVLLLAILLAGLVVVIWALRN